MKFPLFLPLLAVIASCATTPEDPTAKEARIKAEQVLHRVARVASAQGVQVVLFNAPFTCKAGNRAALTTASGLLYLGCWTEADGTVVLAYEDGDKGRIPTNAFHELNAASEQETFRRLPGDLEMDI